MADLVDLDYVRQEKANEDDRVLGNWSFESENDYTIKLKNVDNFGNESFLEIARDFLK